MRDSRSLVRLVAPAVAVLLASAALPPAASGDPAARLAPEKLRAALKPSGDPDGSGTAVVRLAKAKHRVCADISWQNIATPDAAHIHRKSTGAIVVDLTGSVTGGSHCVTGVSGTVIKKLLAHPGRYYVNVHNPTYPAGAIQGTLHG